MAEVVRAEAAADRSKSVAKTDAQLANRLSAAEQRLAAQRAEGLKAAEEAAGEVAEAIVAKLVGSRA
jgi:hypothetical protein